MNIEEIKNNEKYREFYNFLKEENEKYNLTAILEEEDFFVKNIYDSLLGIKFFDKNKTVVEIGSGGGFPSVPIKNERKDLIFTLIEANLKKCGFLKSVKEKFGFEDFSVLCGRAEELSLKEEYREKFDYGVARAVAPTNVLCELILPFVKVGGEAVLYKGSSFKEELDLAKNAISVLGAKVKTIETFDLKKYGSRAIIVLKKEKSTDKAYPRKYAKIKKCPL